MIPILVCREKLTAQAAMDRAVEMLEKSYHDLKAAEKRLLGYVEDRVTDNMEKLYVREDVRRFVMGCKDICVGGLHWT